MASVLAHFEAAAPGYGPAAERGLWRWQRGREARAILTLAGRMAGQSLVDLGCGAGFYARLLADRGAAPVVAVDASPAMLAAIRDPRIETVLGDVATVSLDHRFSRVLLAGVLEFVQNADPVLANARRHLAEGGRVLVLYPPDTGCGRLYRRFHRAHGLTVRLFSPGDMARLAAAAGLRPVGQASAWPLARVMALEAS